MYTFKCDCKDNKRFPLSLLDAQKNNGTPDWTPRYRYLITRNYFNVPFSACSIMVLSAVMYISTRRFWARPSGVSFEAT